MSAPAPPSFHDRLFTVGVTGTNGKTTTVALVAAALGALARPVARTSTLGSFLDDDPLPVGFDWTGFVATMRACLDRGGRYAAVELTSQALLAGFAAAWPSNVGVFTNLTHDHLDAHNSPEHYLASKAQLFVRLDPRGAAVLNGCDPAAELLADVVPETARIVRYGVRSRGEPHAPLDLEATLVETTWNGTRISLRSSDALDAPNELSVRAIGEIFAENALAALAAALVAGVPKDAAAAAIAAAVPPPGRFEVVSDRPRVVVDYAHTPDALERTLNTARALCSGVLTVVFGAGGNRDRDKRPRMGAAAAGADRVVLTSDNPRDEDPARIAAEIHEGLAGHPDVTVELDRRAAIHAAVRSAGEGDVVVIAGKGHEGVQIVGTERRAFSDRDEALAAARSRAGAHAGALEGGRTDREP